MRNESGTHSLHMHKYGLLTIEGSGVLPQMGVYLAYWSIAMNYMAYGLLYKITKAGPFMETDPPSLLTQCFQTVASLFTTLWAVTCPNCLPRSV